MRTLTDDDLRRLSPEERRDLARRLALLTAPPIRPNERRRALFLAVTTAACLGLLPWIVLLAITEPPHYVAAHWDTTWVGFDVAELASLVATAWFAWHRRQVVILAAVVSGTLLVCDAWFD